MNSKLSIRRNARLEDNGFALSSKLYFLHWLNKLFYRAKQLRNECDRQEHFNC